MIGSTIINENLTVALTNRVDNMKSQLAKYVLKTAVTSLSLSLLLSISACSDNSKVEVNSDSNAISEAQTTVKIETPESTKSAEETVVANDVSVVETDNAVIAEIDNSNSIEPELLAVDAGVTLYESNCKVCHANGLLNAPRYGDKAAWSTRIAKGKEALYTHSSQGFNKMPAQAVNGVTEAQVKASVDYMLAAVS